LASYTGNPVARSSNRDEFSRPTKRAIERQARSHCANPACRRLTNAATSDGAGEINIGVASHICAAAPGGPRYDESMTPEQRVSVENGIWLCQDHAHAVDAPDSKFTVQELREWKRLTDEDSWRSIMENVPYGPGMRSPTPDALRDRLRAAATADLAVFRQMERWPRTAVALTLKVDHVDEALSTQGLANAVATLDDLILVAAPGMGKTTTIFQIAEGVLAIGNGTPIIVPLGDWATEGDALLGSILKRGAFSAITAADFRAVAAKSGVVLLLDGWNELDVAARERARVQVTNLKAEFPELGLVISTRRQALDIAFTGTRVDLLPLDNLQQMAIAKAMRGAAGARLIDQAWRTAGVRELVTIPLYLTALLSLPDGTPFPTTKEEVLRRFVAAHEQEARRATALREATGGFQQDYLISLASFATTTGNTSITDANARRAVSHTTRTLVNDGQVAGTVQPDTLLNTLVSNHALVRSGDVQGYSFQHQQFQEWYASHDVESLMTQAIGDSASRDRLKSKILDQRHWEEAILFAVERSARGNAVMKAACSAAILTAFEVDPILAAEMIFRATDEVWSPISATIRDFIGKWHAPGKVDRAVRFMVTSGRPEFGDLLWPLIANPDQQVHLNALRAAARFRPSVLGSEAPQRIAALPLELRKHVLHEIASQSGMDGLDLATDIAKADSNPEVKATVVEALSFRRADRHVADLLDQAGDATYDILARQGHIDDVAVEAVQEGLSAARARRTAAGVSDHERLRALLYQRTQGEHSAEVAEIVGQMEIDPKHDSGHAHLLYEARKHYPQAVADGLLRRVREGRTLFYGADDMLAAAEIALEDDELCEIALEMTVRRDARAEAAASVLGPTAVGRMIDAYLAARMRIRDANGRHDTAAGDLYHELRARIHHTPGASLIAAVQARAATADYEEIGELAGLLSRDSDGDNDRARPFSRAGLAASAALAQEWGERMLATGDANRRQTGAIATLVSHAPSSGLLPLLKRLLDDNLRRFRDFREEAKASGWRQGRAVDEARWPHTREYQRAFIAIRAPETDILMKEYLADEHFGQLAAQVLAAHWSEAHEPAAENRTRGGVDFSGVETRRAAQKSDPAETSVEAEAIFGAIDNLLTESTTEEQKTLAVALGIVGARLPHGQRNRTIERLVALAPRQARANLLLALILAGEVVDIKLVEQGISETFEAAKTQAWILTQSDCYQLRDWLRLLPFCTPVMGLPAIVRKLPEAQRNPQLLEEMIRGLGYSPFAEAEDVLFKLAEDDPRFCHNYQWRTTVLRLGTASTARRLVDLTVAGALDGGALGDNFRWGSELGELISNFPEERAHVDELLKSSATAERLAVLAGALAHNPGPEGLLGLVEFEIRTGRSVWSWRSVERVITEHVPSESWKGAYNVVPIPATELRKALLATAKAASDPAARCLNVIDRVRDEYGGAEAEPRHPDITSGKQWPMLTPDPGAE
jgi:hypothetical protein